MSVEQFIASHINGIFAGIKLQLAGYMGNDFMHILCMISYVTTSGYNVYIASLDYIENHYTITFTPL